jgi:hypothetical protein
VNYYTTVNFVTVRLVLVRIRVSRGGRLESDSVDHRARRLFSSRLLNGRLAASIPPTGTRSILVTDVAYFPGLLVLFRELQLKVVEILSSV